MKFIYTLLACAISLGSFAQPKTSTPKQAPLDRSVVPQPGPAPKIQIGSANVQTLANGMKLIVVENHKLPTVSYNLRFEIDPILEGNKAGYVGLAGDILGKGTTTKSKAQIDEAVDFIGAQLSTSASSVNGSCLSRHSETLLALMQDIIMNPSFPESELDKLRKQSIAGLANEKTDPDAISSKIGSLVRFGMAHPYGEITSETTLKNITRDDLVNYYKANMSPKNATLIVVGDVTPAKALEEANKFFGAWEGNAVPKRKFGTPQLPAANRVAFVAVPGAVQSVIDVTYPIEFRADSPDYLAVMMLNNILGGSGFQTRLMQNLRESKAYTYGCYSEMSADDFIGTFSASASVRNEVTDSAVTQILFELDRLRNELVTEETLKSVKSIMSGSFARRLENAGTVAGFAYNIMKYNFPANHYETYLERLNAVTAQDIQRVAQKYLQPEKCYISVVGNKDVLEKLTAFNKIDKPLLYNADGTVNKGIVAAPRGVTAETVFNNYYKFLGGKENLQKVATLRQSGVMSVMGNNIDYEMLTKDNTMYKMKLTMGPMTVLTQIYNNGKMSMKSMGKDVESTPDMIEDAKMEADFFNRDHLADFGYSAALGGIGELDGKAVYIVNYTNKAGKQNKTEYFEVESGKLLKSTEVAEAPGVGNVNKETVYNTYTNYNGLNFPTSMTSSGGGQVVEITINKVDVNPKLKAKAFKVD